MSKPGGTPIPKRRPFYRDDRIGIFTVIGPDSRITAFEFEEYLPQPPLRNKNAAAATNGIKKTVFNVTDNQILKAWQKLQDHADPIVANLLKERKGLRKK